MDTLNNRTYHLELKRANLILGSGGSVETVWGTIVGDITQQKDLQDTIKEQIPDISGLATKTELSSSLNGKADKSSVYTKEEIDNKIAGSDLTDYYTKQEIEDKGYLTTETDPTVPSWAKQATKPTYTAGEVGALPDTTVIPDVSGLASKTELTESLATKADISSLNGKVDKVEGKGLSTNDYTNEDVAQLTQLWEKGVVWDQVVWVGEAKPPDKSYSIWIDTSKN